MAALYTDRLTIISNNLQVLLVTGGGYDAFNILSSTELLIGDAASWTLVGNSLPVPLWGVRCGTLDNIVYITGKLFN